MKSKKETIEENEPGNIPVITSQMMENVEQLRWAS